MCVIGNAARRVMSSLMSSQSLKRVLIISPHFPPVNAADMHRVRQSLPYFPEHGWEAVTLAVDADYVEMQRDEALLATLPSDTEVHRVTALDYRWTRAFGLGSLALRSLHTLWQAGNQLLAERPFDLVYFSTTAFPVILLGRLWKQRFGVPFVVDLQDPWRSDHYLELPRNERPPKFWFSYRLDKLLEPMAMKPADGILAVTQGYIDTMQTRYPTLGPVASTVIPFGVSTFDFDAAEATGSEQALPPRIEGELRGVYTGVCNSAMEPVLRVMFDTLAWGRRERPDLFGRVRLHFVGTNYAVGKRARPIVMPLAEAAGVAEAVTERTERVPYLDALKIQMASDFLMLVGTLDSDYTASKLYPYIFARRPILAAFRSSSSVIDILDATHAGEVATFDEHPDESAFREALRQRWTTMLERLPYEPSTDWEAFEPYTAREMTRRHVEFFDKVLERAGKSSSAAPTP